MILINIIFIALGFIAGALFIMCIYFDDMQAVKIDLENIRDRINFNDRL
jgi:hypothetical protein